MEERGRICPSSPDDMERSDRIGADVAHIHQHGVTKMGKSVGMELVEDPEQALFKPARQGQLVPADLLARAGKVLFITHFAIGDFAYMQGCFAALKRAYPHLEVHIWVDERRRTSDSAKWPFLKKYAVYDWLAASPHVDKAYTETYSPASYAQSVAAARKEDYPVVVTLTNLDSHQYAALARKIGKDAFIVGLRKTSTRPFNLLRRLGYRNLDAALPLHKSLAYSDAGAHISDLYADWFARAFGITVAPADRFPTVDIPEEWRRHARARFAAWGFDGPGAKTVFVNAFSKCRDRCWPFERALELIAALRAHPGWRDTQFIVNVVPEELARAQELHRAAALPGTVLFSAQENFFQLPAILSLCNRIVTVETVIMHLANAVNVPVVALMRQTTPEWAPIDRANSTIIWTGAFEDWIDRIGVAEVLEVLTQGTHA